MKLRLFAAALAMLPLPALANDFAPAMEAYLASDIRAWASDPVVIDAIRTHNAAHAGMDQAQIDAMDEAWQAEIGTGTTPTIDPILSSAASDFLRQNVEASGGRITEVIVMDSVGLNAAISHVTSDMWQGDEDKFSQTYGVGPDAVHIGDIEKDESSGRYQAQMSFTLTDPQTGEAIGAMTVGLDAESLL